MIPTWTGKSVYLDAIIFFPIHVSSQYLSVPEVCGRIVAQLAQLERNDLTHVKRRQMVFNRYSEIQ